MERESPAGARAGPIAIVAALREELRGLTPLLEEARDLHAGDLRYRRARLGGVEVALAATGIGRKNAERRAGELIAAVAPSHLIATGFAGGLSPGLAAGDIVAAGVVEELASSWSWRAPEALLERAAGAGAAALRIRTGKLVTADSVVALPSEKRRLGAESGGDAVDMESSGVLRQAIGHGVPAVCARAVLDEADYELPVDLAGLISPEGRIRPLAALAAAARAPFHLGRLLELRARARLAGRSLAAYLPALVAALGREP